MLLDCLVWVEEDYDCLCLAVYRWGALEQHHNSIDSWQHYTRMAIMFIAANNDEEDRETWILEGQEEEWRRSPVILLASFFNCMHSAFKANELYMITIWFK